MAVAIAPDKTRREIGILSQHFGVPSYNHTDLIALFPHGDKAIFLDEICIVEEKVFGFWKYEVGTSEHFNDHFSIDKSLPTIVPGVILVEMMNQTALCLDLIDYPQGTRPFILRGLDEVRFRNNRGEFGFRPGTQFLSVAEKIEEKRCLITVEAKVFIAAEYLYQTQKTPDSVARATIKAAVLPLTQ